MPRHVSEAIRLTAEQSQSVPPRPQRVGVYLKLDVCVVDWFRQGGPGYQARINSVLRQFVDGVIDPHHPPSAVEQAQILFERFYAQCFWHMRRDLIVTERDVPAIVQGLRTHGGRTGFLAAEELCR